jgi:disulfide bond formation protein DsbB
MGARTMTVFFTLLTIAANLGLVAVLAAAVTGRGPALRRAFPQGAVVVAFAVALVATAGSLYYSEVVRYTPCQLCWYQRVAMYPLVPILGVALVRRDPAVRSYGIPLAVIGAVIAAYHYQLEWFPTQDAIACSIGVPCSVPWFRELGFVSLPYMALSGFLLIAALLAVGMRQPSAPEPESPHPHLPTDRINR